MPHKDGGVNISIDFNDLRHYQIKAYFSLVQVFMPAALDLWDQDDNTTALV